MDSEQKTVHFDALVSDQSLREAWSARQLEIIADHLGTEETKMPYRITKEGNISHTALPALERIKRVTLILAVITAIVLILTL